MRAKQMQYSNFLIVCMLGFFLFNLYKVSEKLNKFVRSQRECWIFKEQAGESRYMYAECYFQMASFVALLLTI